jgi:hypothetical protein
MQNRNRGFFFIIIPVLLVLAAAYGFFVWKWTYSEGGRAGFVQKLSKKGFVCKTWEGELAMVSMPGAATEKFFFTVWDEKVAADINRMVGKRVELYYEEKLGLPGSCFGETRHYISKVRALDEPAPAIAPALPAPALPAAPAVVAPPALPATPAVPAAPAK